MRRSRLAASLVVFALVLPLASRAQADSAASSSSSAPSASDRETARTLMTQGITQRKNGDLSAALTSFENADSIMHVTTTALEVARTEEALGHLIEARDKALAAMRVPAKPNEPAVLKEARAQLGTLAEALEPRIPSLVIALQGVPAGATANVQMDGADVPAQTLAVTRRVNPGHHVLTADAGAAHGKLELDLAERETKTATVTLGVTAPVVATSAPGDQAPEKKKDPLLIAGIAGLGVGAAGLIVGGVTGYLSLHKTSNLKNECPNDLCPAATYDSSSFQSERSSAKTFGTVSTVGFIAGGVFAAAGATFLVLRSRAPHEGDAKAAAFVVGPGFAYGSF